MSSAGKTFLVRDFLVVLLCLTGAAYTFNLFRLDLNQTLNIQNKEPLGIVILKKNIVQRRLADRVLWDRLSLESPVYAGDVIRVADLSDATLDIEGSQISLPENTLIRIRAPDGKGPVQIELASGSLSLAAGEESANLILTVMGRQIETTAGTQLTASAGDNGMTLSLSKGQVLVLDNDQAQELIAPAMLSFGTDSNEQEPAVVIVQPRPGARFLKNGQEPLGVVFAWNRINMEPSETLSLEIARNGNFDRIVQRIENVNSRSTASLDAGLWHWRLTGDKILNTGQFTIIETSIRLLFPANNQRFIDEGETQHLYFEWEGVAEADYYILEAAASPDFLEPVIKRQIPANNYTGTSLGQGTWYWRVLPVFSNSYEGITVYTPTATFSINPIEEPQPVSIVMAPEPSLQNARETAFFEGLQNAPEPEVQPLPLLPAAGNRRPVNRHRIGIEELSTQRNIVFSWSQVQGANAYILTLFREIAGRRQEIRRTQPLTRTTWTLDDLKILDHGTFIWQIEAENRDQAGIIQQRGRIGENSFVIDLPHPGEIQIEIEAGEEQKTIYVNQ
ncbi:MAG: FecR family protein [Treponema sp.]|nr:FecR family protein [Treponema sp.]